MVEIIEVIRGRARTLIALRDGVLVWEGRVLVTKGDSVDPRRYDNICIDAWPKLHYFSQFHEFPIPGIRLIVL